MLKKYSIISIFLFAYTIVLGHSIIPHHHHHHLAELTTHHHDDNQEENQEENHDGSDDDGLSHDLGNYFHSGDTQDIYQQTDSKASINIMSSVYIFSECIFFIKTDEIPLPVLRITNDCILHVQHCTSSKGMRAPPCDLV